MKKILRISIYIIIVLSITTSCKKDMLDPAPTTQIFDKAMFDTSDRINGQVYGLYDQMRSFLSGRYFVFNDVRGDDFLNIQSNAITGYMTWSQKVEPSTNEVQYMWGDGYMAINMINVFLEGLEGSDAVAKKVISENEYKQFKGEALALRGLAYFYLLQLYARPYNQNPDNLGLVMRLKAEKSSANNNMARSTVKQTYEQILSDLNSAESLVPLSYDDADVNLTRIQRNSIIALKTRVYLHMNNFSAVLTEGNKIVPTEAPFKSATGVTYQLASPFSKVFTSPFSSSESIFSIAFTSSELPGTQRALAFYFSAPTVGGNEYPLNVSSPVWQNLTDFPATDKRRLLTKEDADKTYLFIDKYKSVSDYVPIIRYAEVLLNVAEAEAKTNGVNDRAVALLNAVHSRSESTKTYKISDFTDANAFVAQLLKERNMEFLGEGIRAMDIMRTLQPFGAKGNIGAVLVTAKNYVWPIPQTELNSNSLIVQN